MEQKINKIDIVLRIFRNVWVKTIIKALVVFLLFDMVLSLNTVSNKFLKSATGYTEKNSVSLFNLKYRLNKDTITEIDQLVKRVDLITAIQVSIVDFQKNTREIIYTSMDDSDLLDIYSHTLSASIPEKPLFTNSDASNQKLIALINGEFICEPFKNTIDFKLIPLAESYISTVCSIGFPPGYGKIIGIVSIYTKTPPNDMEKAQLSLMARDLSLSIYTKYLSRL